MQEQIKSVQSTAQNDVYEYKQSENKIYSQMNKTYDDCDSQKGLISVAMKIVPIILYLILKFSTDEQLGVFLLISLLIAADFWTTKNILGPKLVGLKWFSVEDQNQHQKWCFATCSQNRIISKINSLFFWMPQLVAILFWIIITLLNLITLGLFWVALAIYAAFLLIINFAFFLQCKGEHQEKVNFLTKKLGFELYKKQENFEQTSFNK